MNDVEEKMGQIEGACSQYEDGKRYCMFCSAVAYPPLQGNHKHDCPIAIAEAALKAAKARMAYEATLDKGETVSDGLDERLRLYDVMEKAEAAFAALRQRVEVDNKT